MSEKFLRALSGIDNLKGIFWGRLIIGFVLLGYGFLIFLLNFINDQWTKISVAAAFWGLGLMFVLDGQSVLREYFSNNQKMKIFGEQLSAGIINLLKIIFIIGSILFFVKFYALENPSLYPLVIFLISVLLTVIIITFRKDIISLKISKEGFEISLANQTSSLGKKVEDLTYEVNELRKRDLNFKIEAVK